MNYHNITTDDMLNGTGLRVCLWVSGCEHKCDGCHNKVTWNPDAGIRFDGDSERELFDLLAKPHISGLTVTGGDPLHPKSLKTLRYILSKTRLLHGNKKSIWLYSGYTWEEIYNGVIAESLRNIGSGGVKEMMESINTALTRQKIIQMCDVFVDGKFVKELYDANYHWAGSTNQRVIDVHKSLENNGEIVLFDK